MSLVADSTAGLSTCPPKYNCELKDGETNNKTPDTDTVWKKENIM